MLLLRCFSFLIVSGGPQKVKAQKNRTRHGVCDAGCGSCSAQNLHVAQDEKRWYTVLVYGQRKTVCRFFCPCPHCITPPPPIAPYGRFPRRYPWENGTLPAVESPVFSVLSGERGLLMIQDEQTLRRTTAKNIAAYRKAHKDTQLDLARKLNYSDKSVSKWERGEGDRKASCRERV